MKTLFSYNLTLEEAKDLIKKGADVNDCTQKNNKTTPLHFVIDVKIAGLLIDNKADVNAKNNYDETPFTTTYPNLFIDENTTYCTVPVR